MRHQISNISKMVKREDQYIFQGQGGFLSLSFYTDRILRVDYGFDGLDMPAIIKDNANFIVTASPDGGEADISETDSSFSLKRGGMEVRVGKEKASVSVSFEGKVVQGASIGNMDTVVPSFQARAFSCQGRNVFARFNFPLEKDDEFFGLGDKSGKPDRRGRRFSMFNRDSLGYDAENSDPLYKSIPFFLKVNRRKGTISGTLINAPLIDYVDFARESEFYYSYQIKWGSYSYFIITGNDYKEILSGYAALTGHAALPPLYSFGFFASSMNYADPDDAVERIEEYFSNVEKYEIPCEGMYLSSGYLKADSGERFAFVWNRKKFPDPKAFVMGLKERGYHLIMNIKPGFLKTHPWYDELERKGYFIKDQDGKSYLDYFWGGYASFIDFLNPEAYAWWKEELKKCFLENGCSGIWNDNNEFEIEDIEVPCHSVRTLLPIEMCHASFEAFDEMLPEERPWIYSRSGYAGMQRYARTWSGDNVSDWKTLKNNQYMALGLSLSGVPFYGHDLGGFYGDSPSRELLIRSCQSGVFQPRFVIHSWRSDGHPTEPWTYPEALDEIRYLIRQHYRFLPYTYSSAIESSLTGLPIDRMLALEFPDDGNMKSDLTYSLFGPSIINAPVTEEGVDEIRLTLPSVFRWFDGNTGKEVPSGIPFSHPSPLCGNVSWFAAEGSAIATKDDEEKLSGPFKRTRFLVFPTEGSRTNDYYEDDGISRLEKGRYNHWVIVVDAHRISFTLKKKGLTAQGRLFLFDGQSFNPDGLKEGECISFDLKNNRKSI